MLQQNEYLVPVTLAVLLHIVMFGSLFVALDFGERTTLAMPLAIKGTLVTDNAVVIPPRVKEVPFEPPISERQRIDAEELKRQQDAKIERQRLSRIAEQEAERKRRAEAAERKRQADEEALKERRRLDAERKREEEIERQRLENLRLRREAESTARQVEIDAEFNRFAAVDAGELAAYQFAIQQKVRRNWVEPASSRPGLKCEVRVQQLPGGAVVSVSILTCNGDAAVRRSIVAAIEKASPLPIPSNPNLFDRNLRFTFRPEQ